MRPCLPSPPLNSTLLSLASSSPLCLAVATTNSASDSARRLNFACNRWATFAAICFVFDPDNKSPIQRTGSNKLASGCGLLEKAAVKRAPPASIHRGSIGREERADGRPALEWRARDWACEPAKLNFKFSSPVCFRFRARTTLGSSFSLPFTKFERQAGRAGEAAAAAALAEGWPLSARWAGRASARHSNVTRASPFGLCCHISHAPAFKGQTLSCIHVMWLETLPSAHPADHPRQCGCCARSRKQRPLFQLAAASAQSAAELSQRTAPLACRGPLSGDSHAPSRPVRPQTSRPPVHGGNPRLSREPLACKAVDRVVPVACSAWLGSGGPSLGWTSGPVDWQGACCCRCRCCQPAERERQLCKRDVCCPQ